MRALQVVPLLVMPGILAIVSSVLLLQLNAITSVVYNKAASTT